jgi:hypothetical protein
MTIALKVIVHCDSCGQEHTLQTKANTDWKEMFRKMGWDISIRRDLCPPCLQAVIEKRTAVPAPVGDD